MAYGLSTHAFESLVGATCVHYIYVILMLVLCVDFQFTSLCWWLRWLAET